ncbi:septal ring lytic transglycosylase RlpA family protein [Dichotomicrobium thermohalophilum]|uniref:Endolytic peptidoglycan transglycosylase RlpA n=1 Tax=Dichotomicrobium thermohalophilum TaxID=933063 RepID=A0A397QAC9_9HYPH|nr:rare lipoprotein A [Dichotomicrobium thermohalophilum]
MSLTLASTGEATRGESALGRVLGSSSETDDETQKLSPRLVRLGEPVPKGGGVRKIGDPYVAAGETVVPREDADYDQAGIASWYGEMFHGRQTANGEIYDMNALTAAHPTLPLPSYVKVTHLGNGRSLVLRVNDRGPFKRNRVIDLSRRAATLLGIRKPGTGPVRVKYLRPAPLDGDDSFEQAYLASQPWYQDQPTRLGAVEPGLQARSERPRDG